MKGKLLVASFQNSTAPFFLCNFTVTNGKFTLWPVLPVDKEGRFKDQQVFVKQIFTEGNIIDGSYKMTYLDADDRRAFKASMRYRQVNKNQLPEERVLTTRWYTGKWSDDTEDFDMTQFCTTQEHALLAARYILWIRNVVTHSVSFSTVPEVMNGVGPGDFIRFKMTTVHINRSSTAAVDPKTRQITSASTWPDGNHTVGYWKPGMPEPALRQIGVFNNQVTDLDMGGALMSLRQQDDDECPDARDDVNNPYMNIYQVETVNLTEEGLVDVTCTHYPCTKDGVPDLYNALFALGKYRTLYDPESCG